MTPSLSVALLGTGYIASYHLDVLRAIPGVKVVGACDQHAGRLAEFCDHHQIPCRAASLADLLRQRQPQVVHILTPPPTHYALAKEALQLGLSVFIEKPMALSHAHCLELSAIARAKKLHCVTNHNLVYLPVFAALCSEIKKGLLGPIDHVVSINNLPLGQLDAGDHDHWMFREPGNILFEQGPHPLSLVISLLGEARSVHAIALDPILLKTGKEFHSKWLLTLVCERGTAEVHLAWGRQHLAQSLQVIGRDGSASIDLANSDLRGDRPTQYLEPVDRFLRQLGQARASLRAGIGGLAAYGLSTLKLRGRSDSYFLSMKGSIEAFYRTLLDSPPAPCPLGEHVIHCIEQAIASAAPIIQAPVSRVALASPQETALTNAPGVIAQREILVLGGTGFIGRRLVERLQSMGYPVRLLARKPDLAARLLGKGAKIVAGDIRSEQDINQAIRGCKVVYHLASGAPPSWREYEQLFMHATRQIAEACLRHGVEQLHYTSSIAALYLGDPEETITEETPADPMEDRRSEYARAKILCERLLLELHARQQLGITIHRPGVVIGPGGMIDHLGVGYWPNMLHCISWGKDVDRPLPFVLADDVAEALALANAAPGLAGRCLNLVGDAPLTARSYVKLLSQFLGSQITLHRQSFFRWQAIDVAKWIIKLAARKAENPYPSYRDLVSRSLASKFDTSRAKLWLGWRPVADQDELIERGIRQAVAARSRP